MTDFRLTSTPTNFDFTKKYTAKKSNGSTKLDLYSYTGRVKFFDKEKGFGYIQEIPDTKNLKNVVKEWRITAEQLGNTAIHRGDFVYFMKHGKTIGEISPINYRDLLKTPCPECGRRDYIPGKNSVCKHCGHQFDTDFNDSRDNDPAFNCLAGTNENKACPVCGRHAWKRYGYHQDIRCRCCGSDYPPSIFKIWILNVEIVLLEVLGFVLFITFLFYIFIKVGWVF